MLPIIILPFPTETTVQYHFFHDILDVKAQRGQRNKPGVVHFLQYSHNQAIVTPPP